MKKLFIVLLISVISSFSVSAQTEFETILSQIHADSLKKTVEDMVAFNNRLCCATVGNNKKVAQYIIQRLHSYGVENAKIDSFPVKIQQHFLVGNVNQYMYNVKSRLCGSVDADSVAIIGAHLDAICYDNNNKIQSTTPGANDNAAGIAIMIEVARIFHANNLTPKYSIDFMAFDAEELGLFGSNYDANKRKSAHEKVYVMLNNDMVGLQSEKENEWKVIFYADAENVEYKAKNICQDYTRLLPYIPNYTDIIYQYSDSWEYRKLGFGTFFTHEYENDPHYHNLLDLPQRLNYNYMAEIAKLHFSLLYDFAIDSITAELAVKEPFIASTFSIYPNPTKNELRISLPSPSEGGAYEAYIQIYSVVGQCIYTSPNPSKTSAPLSFQGGEHTIPNFFEGEKAPSLLDRAGGEVVIDISHLATGMYYLKIGNKTARFIKE